VAPVKIKHVPAEDEVGKGEGDGMAGEGDDGSGTVFV